MNRSEIIVFFNFSLLIALFSILAEKNKSFGQYAFIDFTEALYQQNKFRSRLQHSLGHSVQTNCDAYIITLMDQTNRLATIESVILMTRSN